MKKRKQRPLVISSSIVLVLVLFCVFYVNDYYHADMDAISTYSDTLSSKITMTEIPNALVVTPELESIDTGFIFYPGGKVEYTSYLPLMETCASEGILCVLVEMPFNLAVLNMNRASGIPEQFPEIENWYIGGHSLGGSMASSYVINNAEDYKGVILLGSYSTADLSECGLDVLSIYGSNDKVLNAEKYDKYKSNLPNDLEEYVIDGGCHAYFGMYGEQDGDGVATITNIEQIEQTVQEIVNFVSK